MLELVKIFALGRTEVLTEQADFQVITVPSHE